MKERFKQLTDYLVSLGTDKIPHSQTPFLAHLIGVYRDLQRWGCEERVCLAGLFHSIYGTEAFQRFTLPLTRRTEIRDLIGEGAERIAYLNCAMTRASFDASVATPGAHALWDRFEDREVQITAGEFRDLLLVHLCDRLEQVGRTQNWDYRFRAFQQMAERLGGVALDSWRQVFESRAEARVATG